VSGAILGVLWGLASNDSQWLMYHPEMENTDNQLCRLAAMESASSSPTAGAMAANNHCQTANTYASAGWALGGVGAALLVAGVVLLVTDHPADAPAGDRSAANHRSHRPRFNFVPTFSPAYQGATLSLTF
jgi:hypothetical protein